MDYLKLELWLHHVTANRHKSIPIRQEEELTSRKTEKPFTETLKNSGNDQNRREDNGSIHSMLTLLKRPSRLVSSALFRAWFPLLGCACGNSPT